MKALQLLLPLFVGPRVVPNGCTSDVDVHLNAKLANPRARKLMGTADSIYRG